MCTTLRAKSNRSFTVWDMKKQNLYAFFSSNTEEPELLIDLSNFAFIGILSSLKWFHFIDWITSFVVRTKSSPMFVNVVPKVFHLIIAIAWTALDATKMQRINFAVNFVFVHNFSKLNYLDKLGTNYNTFNSCYNLFTLLTLTRYIPSIKLLHYALLFDQKYDLHYALLFDQLFLLKKIIQTADEHLKI